MPYKSCHGFTLVEVLVSLVILALGILGTIAMQTYALNDSQDAYLRTQAIFLVHDIGDRIRANTAGWAFVPSPFDFACNQPGANCLPVQMAQFDYGYWQNAVATQLPGGVGEVHRRGALCSGAAAEGLGVKITWPRANVDITNRLGPACFSVDIVL